VNMLEGRLAVDEPDRAVVEADELATPIYFDHGVTGAGGATVWAALRPEKIELKTRAENARPPVMEDAPDGCNVAAGIIHDITYLGSESMFDVRLPSGRDVKVLRSNLTRWDQEDFAIGDAVWLTWRACAPALLLS
jgi:ABC-type Fe3+/spermidine/putrescine transport system ATPase subunit